jgi:hypothetical protein
MSRAMTSLRALAVLLALALAGGTFSPSGFTLTRTSTGGSATCTITDSWNLAG